MKKILLLVTIILINSCKNDKKEKSETTSEASELQVEPTSEEADEILLLGLQSRNALEKAPYLNWYEENYNYEPNGEILEILSQSIENISFIVFMGTWCEDSQLHVPAFFKIIDQLGIPEEQVRLIAVSRDKDTPEKLEEDFDLAYVPTIILYKDKKELGRIVEWPIETIEKDMLTILSGEDYKHTYAE